MISKAADAGYKIIIVLAGLHKNLRSQTQIRVEEGFLGYDNSRRADEGYRAVGVGLEDPRPSLRPDSVTTRADDGDFNTNRARNFAINPGGRPLVFVIKKQKSVLQNLIDWVRWAQNDSEGKVAGIPLLLIDDEADHASVNTKDGAFDENGEPDPEHDPSTINGLIRKLLNSFQQKAYVGYTATPFANIFIHEQAETEEAGPDLFPSSFIISLPAPSNYFGPSHVFSVDDDADGSDEHRYVREVWDHADSLAPDEDSGWIPPKHRNGWVPRYHGELRLPPSVRRAVHSFVLATAIRRVRGQTSEHNSMLVHVSRFTSVQNMVKEQIADEVRSLKRELRYGEIEGEQSSYAELRDLFASDFELQLDDDNNPNGEPLTWDVLEPEVRTAVDLLRVKEINGTAGDILDYEQERAEGLTVIAVGGDKLSRGLTLEGLTTSYFLRASRMYDTLMQMGRWFGYRKGYEDVCRLYMTADLREWFENITVAADELREEFDHMAAVGGTPRNYGLRVRSHPALMVTSRVKMRSGTPMKLSFAGTMSETVVFSSRPEVIEANLQAAERLVEALGDAETDPVRERPEGRTQTWRNGHYWSGVDARHIKAFLASYATHPDSVKANSHYLRQFIEKQNEKGDLVSWNVALLSGKGGEKTIGGCRINMVERNPLVRNLKIPAQIKAEKYVIGRVVSPRDEAIDLGKDEYTTAVERTQEAWRKDPGTGRKSLTLPDEPSGPAIRDVRPQSTGLLILYPLSPDNAVIEKKENPVMAMALSFPTSENAIEIDYVVNNVFAMSDEDL
nr:Z1 domain-containing protein [Sphingomicrobium sp. B8]